MPNSSSKEQCDTVSFVLDNRSVYLIYRSANTMEHSLHHNLAKVYIIFSKPFFRIPSKLYVYWMYL
jgi:hypothetical protein